MLASHLNKLLSPACNCTLNRLCGFMVFLSFLVLPFFSAHTAASWVASSERAGDFPLVNKKLAAPIVVSIDDFKVVSIAAKDLAADVERVTGKKPLLKNSLQDLKVPAVVVGTLGKSPLIDQLVAAGKLDATSLRNTWESFLITTVENPQPGLPKILVIAGSDRRGTAFGIYELSQAIGVSPWYWWSDVEPEKRTALFVKAGTHRFGPPSVKYRGIFINDEGWGIHRWAANTFEPENGGVGPKTYEKVFELMLRLKANTLWPAMHPVTKPFNFFPQNAQLADDYAIVMGSSHAEPMLRNNVGEWSLPHDQYNYVNHQEKVSGYWQERMKTNGRYENIYTIGMRGIHDSLMQGPQNDAERIDLLHTIFKDQRALINKYSEKPAEQVPQMFCAYKEVLGLYRQGLQVPDDVTIVWPDDNFGYMRNFANAEERKRSGGFGVYYHISYLGAPMAYLWLNTVPPSLIWQEMSKSYDMGADRMWIVNVGDIKPGEVGIELFLQMAWDINRWQRDNIDDFLVDWAQREFGEANAQEIAQVMKSYYQLNFQRKPEHLQWWLPRTEPSLSNFSEAEAAERIQTFSRLRLQTEHLYQKIPAAQRDAFFQLVGYPVIGSAWANLRFLEGERGNSDAAHAADARLQQETARWNTSLAKGKWKDFMATEPADALWDKYRITSWKMPYDELLAGKKQAKPATAGKHSFAIEAEDFNRKTDRSDVAWEVIPNLGKTGSGSVALFPVARHDFAENQLAEKSPYLEYEVSFAKTGKFVLHVHLIPTHPLSGNLLRFAVGLNSDAPEVVSLDVQDGSPAWAQGVLNATRVATTTLQVTKTGKQTLRIYGVDAGVLLDKIVVDIDGIPDNYLGLSAREQPKAASSSTPKTL
jgi:hypothetical protein